MVSGLNITVTAENSQGGQQITALTLNAMCGKEIYSHQYCSTTLDARISSSKNGGLFEEDD